MSDVLEKLFGSGARVKIMRLFLMNPEEIFSAEEISRRSNVPKKIARREIFVLRSADFIRTKISNISELIKLKNGKLKNSKKKIHGFMANEFFPFLYPLKNLLVESANIDKEKLAKSLKNLSRAKLVVFSGVFVGIKNGEADILLVGDNLKRGDIEKILKKTESKIGREINYCALGTEDFLYRFAMNDRFVRNILDYPHEKILNKLDI